MSWWKRATDPSAEGRVGKPARPNEIEVISGSLFAQVQPHVIPRPGSHIDCWSYVSRGLAALGQPEIVVTLHRDPGAESGGFPRDPLHLFATLYRLAAEGRRVGRGDVTEFGDEGFLGHHLLYVDAQPLEGVPLPPSSLAALLINSDELRAVREFGPTRVLAGLGRASTYYPFPPWSDGQRRAPSLASMFEDSVLSTMPRVLCPDVCVTVGQAQILVSPLRGAQSSWSGRLAGLADDTPFALLTALDPTADGCLVWEPGQRGPEAITPEGSEGSRLCGCFIGLLPEQSANGGLILEDGLLMKLTAASWNAVRGALIDGRDIVIPPDGAEMSLALTWREQDYVSPIDGQVEVAENGWVCYEPAEPPPAARPGLWSIRGLRLLMLEDEMAARTSPEEVAAFCQEVVQAAQRTIGGDDTVELLARMRCTPDGHDVEMAFQGDVSQQRLQACFDAINEIAPLRVRDGEVSFQIELGVSPQ
jgi:hypothetical protein